MSNEPKLMPPARVEDDLEHLRNRMARCAAHAWYLLKGHDWVGGLDALAEALELHAKLKVLTQ